MSGDIGDDRLHFPVAVAILDIASITIGKELGIVDIIARPVLGAAKPGANAHFWLRVCVHHRLLPTE